MRKVEITFPVEKPDEEAVNLATFILSLLKETEYENVVISVVECKEER